MAFQAIRYILPRDYGEVHGMFMAMILLMNFLGYYFKFWTSIITITFVIIFQLGVIRPVIYLEPVGGSVFAVLLWTFFMFCCCLGYHILFQWMADIYVESELPRSRNEELLNGLKESVFIIE